MKNIEIVIDNNILEEYRKFYFNENPRRQVFPFKSPIPPSLNSWMVKQRPAMNDLKQKWTNFMIWIVNHYGYSNLNINKCEIEIEYYFKDKRRRDADNYTPKNLFDGLVKSKLIKDDSFGYVKSLKISGFVDKDNPRMIIKILF